MKNVLIFDLETTISNKGNPFDRTNKAVVLGLKWRGVKENIILYREDFHQIQGYIDKASVLVGFNAKFDLHWLRKVGIDISKVNIWDCQLGEFILNNQKIPYPSLNDALAKYGFPLKLDVVKTEYWDKGIDTDQIPRNILTEYLIGDLEGTESVFEEQFKQFENDSRKTLFKLHCLDLLVLEEMEWNGIKFNTKKAKAKADEIEKELIEINQELMGIVGDVPINFNSNVHLSALLYGGSFSVDFRIPIGVYKSGTKIGQVRHKILEKVYDFPRLVEPIKGTETATSRKKSLETGAEPSQWEVNDTVLRKLKLSKEAEKIVTLLKRNSELEKLRGTYLIGYSNLIEKMNWPTDTLHGTLNQCRVVTGRLSSASPNLQNADPTTKIFMETRY